MRIAIVSMDDDKKMAVAESLQDYNPLPLLRTEVLPTVFQNPVSAIMKKHLQNTYITTTSLYDLYVRHNPLNSSIIIKPIHWLAALYKIKYDHTFYIPLDKNEVYTWPLTYKSYSIPQDVYLKVILDFFHVPYNTLLGSVEEMVEQAVFILGYGND